MKCICSYFFQCFLCVVMGSCLVPFLALGQTKENCKGIINAQTSNLEPPKEFLPFHIGMSLTPPERYEDGVISYEIRRGGGDPQKIVQLELPAILSYLAFFLPSIDDAIVITAAGNTDVGDNLYNSTYHNMGFHLLDYIMHKIDALSGYDESKQVFIPASELNFKENIEITYDDSSQRKGEVTFHSQPILFRTKDLEVFLTKIEFNGKSRTLIFLKPIGDYNEVGDVVVPASEVMGIPPERLVFIHDNLRLPTGQREFQQGPINPNGNNSVFSMNRALVHLMIDQIKNALAENEMLKDVIPQFAQPISAALLELKERAYLTEGKAKVLVNIDAITNALKEIVLKKHIYPLFSQMVQKNRKEQGALRSKIQAINQERTENSGTEEETLAALEAEKTRLINEMNIIEANKKQLDEKIAVIIKSTLSFHRMSLGTKPTDVELIAGELPQFVLSKFPVGIYDEQFFEGAYQDLLNYIGKQLSGTDTHR